MDWDRAGVDWAAVPASWPEAPFAPPLPVRFVLPGGVRVFLLENHRLPLVSVRVLHGAAGTREDGARPGLAALTADLLDEGAGGRRAIELSEELERLGARMTIGASVDRVTLSLDTLTETLEPALAIAADATIRPALAADDFDRIKSERLADLALRPDSPRAIAGVVFEQIVFGAHPYASPGSGWVDTVEHLTLDDVKAFWKTHYAPKATTLVVAGDVTRAQLEPMLRRTWSGWKGVARPAPAGKRPTPRPPVLAFVDRPGAPQSVVTIGRLGPDAADPRRAPLDVANTAVGGSFAARLNARLREELGYTYGIFSTVWRGSRAGAWSVSSSIRTDVTGAGIREVLAILQATAASPLPADELAKSQSLIVRGLPQDFETNGATAGAYANLIADGRPLTSYRDLPGQIARVTAASAQQAGARQWKDLSIVVVGDWSLVGKDLEALGLPIVRYGADGRPPTP
jgi:zinc protease